MEKRHLLIHGLVQGVGFRAALAREAERQGVSGWVRNRHDGTVEALICGSAEAVAALIAWARHGPRAAHVDRVEVELGNGDFSGFEQRPTE